MSQKKKCGVVLFLVAMAPNVENLCSTCDVVLMAPGRCDPDSRRTSEYADLKLLPMVPVL